MRILLGSDDKRPKRMSQMQIKKMEEEIKNQEPTTADKILDCLSRHETRLETINERTKNHSRYIRQLEIKVRRMAIEIKSKRNS